MRSVGAVLPVMPSHGFVCCPHVNVLIGNLLVNFLTLARFDVRALGFCPLGAMGSTKPQYGKPLKESIVKKIHARTRKCIEFFDVSEGFDLKLKKLKVEVLPELGKVEFNYGKMPARVGASITIPNANHGDSSIAVLEKYFQDFKEGRADIVGVAGSGKTTLLKVIAQRVMDRRLTCLDDIELVFYLDCQTLPGGSTKLSLKDVIFYDMELDKNEKVATMSYIKEYPSRSLFILDSVDNVSRGLSKPYRTLGKKDVADPAFIVSQLIDGKFFTKSGFRVITSEREHTSQVVNQSNPQTIFELRGLTVPSIARIVIGYLGDQEGEKFMHELKTQSPSLLSLCRIPVFLAYTLMGKTSGEDFKTSKMSGVMAVVLNSFLRSQHSRSENIEQIFCKLKELSLEGIKTKRMVFSDQDLKNQKLDGYSENDLLALRGLAHMSPGKGRLFQFNHLSIQEMLAAICVAEKNFSYFQSHFKSEFETHGFTVVHELVFGLLFDDEVFSYSRGILKEGDDFEAKKEFLKSFVKEKLARKDGILDDLKLLRFLHESGNGLKSMVKDHVHSIKIEDTLFPLSSNDAFLIGSVAASSHQLDSLSVSRTGLRVQSASALCETIQKSSTRITELKARNNVEINDGIAYFGKLVSTSQSKIVDMHGCEPTEQAIEKFQKELGSHRVDKVDLSISDVSADEWKEENESREAMVYGDLDPQCLKSDDLSETQLRNFREKIHSTKLRFRIPVNVVGTWKRASTHVLDAVVNLIPLVSKELILHGWKFTEQQRDKLSEAIKYLPKGLTLSLAKGDLLRSNEPRRWDESDELDTVKTPNGIRAKWSKITESDPPKVTDVLAKRTVDGIIVTWRAKAEAIRFRLQTYENETKLPWKVVASDEYLHTDVKPNTSYRFYVCAQSESGMLGEEAGSNVVHVHGWESREEGTTETPEVPIPADESEAERSDETSSLGVSGLELPEDNQNLLKASGPQQVHDESSFQDNEECEAATNDSQDCPTDLSISMELSNFLEKSKGISWEEIQLAHDALTHERMKLVSSVIRSSKGVDNLEFRGCELTAQSLEKFFDLVKDSDVHISGFSVTAEDNIEILIPAICKILRASKASLLDLGENDISDKTLTVLKDHLVKNPVETLQCLDVSYNKDLQDFTLLAKILDLCPVSDLRLMNCDIGEDKLSALKSSLKNIKIISRASLLQNRKDGVMKHIRSENIPPKTQEIQPKLQPRLDARMLRNCGGFARRGRGRISRHQRM